MQPQENSFTYVGPKEGPSWPTSLLTAEEAAALVGVGVERLRALAESEYVPHYRIDGGEPVFRGSELKRWCAENLLKTCPGKLLPPPVIVCPMPERVDNHALVPHSIRNIVGLCDITTESRRCGIYFLVKDMTLMYIGQSVNVVGRVATHASINPYKNEQGKDFNKVFYLQWPADDLDRMEGALIRALKPPLNGRNVKGDMLCPGSNKVNDDAKVLANIGFAP